MRLSQKSIITPEDLGSRILHVVTWRLLERIRPNLEATEKHTGRQFNSTSKMEERKENTRKMDSRACRVVIRQEEISACCQN